LKTKTGSEVVENMEKVFKQQGLKNLQTDMGKECFKQNISIIINEKIQY
jgi:hypothetical protein